MIDFGYLEFVCYRNGKELRWLLIQIKLEFLKFHCNFSLELESADSLSFSLSLSFCFQRKQDSFFKVEMNVFNQTRESKIDTARENFVMQINAINFLHSF